MAITSNRKQLELSFARHTSRKHAIEFFRSYYTPRAVGAIPHAALLDHPPEHVFRTKDKAFVCYEQLRSLLSVVRSHPNLLQEVHTRLGTPCAVGKPVFVSNIDFLPAVKVDLSRRCGVVGAIDDAHILIHSHRKGFTVGSHGWTGIHYKAGDIVSIKALPSEHFVAGDIVELWVVQITDVYVLRY